jgi:outer membrane lipoprotein-sorting protein
MRACARSGNGTDYDVGMFNRRIFPVILISFLLALLLPAAAAQDLAAGQVLANLKSSVAELEDVSFLLYGSLQADDGTRHGIEVEVEMIPDLNLVRLYILQPDALADNFIILAADATYSYNYLTNQVIIYAANDPTPFGPLTGGSAADGAATPFRLTLDPDELFSGWDVQLAPESGTVPDSAYELVFLNPDPAAAIGSALVTVAGDSWLPLAASLFTASGSVLAELEVQDLQADQGLESADLLWLPSDAEIIDERR